MKKNSQKNLEKKKNVEWGRGDSNTILYQKKKNSAYSLKKKGESAVMVIRSKYWLPVNKSCQVHFNFLFLWGNLDRVTKES